MQQLNPTPAVDAEQPAIPIPKTLKQQALIARIVETYFADPTRGRKEVAAKLGITEGQVNYWIKKSGHKLRLRGEAIRLSATGRPRRDSVDKWPIVEGVLAGKSPRQIAQELNRFETSISRACRRMGLPPKTCHIFGEVLDKDKLRHLLKMSESELDVRQLAQKLSMPSSTLADLVSSTRKPDKQLHYKTARKIADWYESFFRRLMGYASTQKGRRAPRPLGGYGQSSVISTFFQNFGARYSLLLQVLTRLAEDEDHRLAKKLENPEKDPEWQRNELKEYLCEEAVRENVRKSPGLFVQFLPWAPRLMKFFPENLQDLHVDRQLLAYKILAGWLGATKGVIPVVLNPSGAERIKPIPASQMSELILLQNGAEHTLGQPQKPQPEASKGGKRDPGRPKLAPEKKAYFEVGPAVEREIPLFEQLFEVKKTTPASAELLSLGFTQQQIDAALSSRTPLIAARRFISNTYLYKGKLLEYDTVAGHHQTFVRLHRTGNRGLFLIAT